MEKVKKTLEYTSQEVIDLMKRFPEVKEKVSALKLKLEPLYYEHIRTCYGCTICKPMCPECILRL
jgi:NAD-dependent dihydropyrimidine dehydrogenase PreA subunit